MRVSLGILAVVFCSALASGQQNSISLDRWQSYKTGSAFFENSLYGPARYMHQQFIKQIHPPTEDEFSNLKDESAAMMGISGLRLDLSGSENDLIRFINQKYSDPVTTAPILELGSYYYNKKWFKKATEMYAMAELSNLPEYDMSEASFKKGYSHFVSKEFKQAKDDLARTKDIQNIFYYPSNYYFGLCDYFTGNYKNAVSSFEKVKSNEAYKSFVPYYITQIYFAEGQSEKVISHGEEALKDNDLRNRKEIRQLIGQSYFKMNQYEKALPHLEYYEAQTEKMTIEEFYQLGFTQYQLKKYDAAIKNFRELNLQDTKLGQLVNYYLADCYYKTGDLVSARAAFKKVSQMDYEKNMQEEALFNYGKLSAEAGFEREAINTLIKIKSGSKYMAKADQILSDLLENSSDYASVIQVVESMPSPSEKLKATYQNACLKQGMVQYNSGNTDSALSSLAKVSKFHVNKIASAQSQFWTAQMLHEKGDYKSSIQTFENYFDVSNGLEGLPDESAIYMGHYAQGYNYLELKDYKNAEKSFKNALVAFNLHSKKIKNQELLNNVWPDAMVRTGDCLFKANKYADALGFYDKAIQQKKGGLVYALFQKGMIEGLTGEPYEKILTLRDLKTDYPTSEYADDALLQLGETYFDLENTDNAYNSFLELVTKYKNSPLRNAAYLKLGLLAYNKGDMTTAISHYKNIMENNPSARETESALLGLKEIYVNDLGKSDEYVAYVSTIPGYKITGSAADSLAYMVGALRYNDGEYEKAIAGFTSYLTKYPEGGSKIRAIYYRAESNTLLKKYDKAMEDYEALAKLGSSEFYMQSLKKAGLISYNYTQSFEKAFQYYDLYYANITDEEEKYKAALGALRSAFRINKSEAVKKYGVLVSSSTKANLEERAAADYYLGKSYFRDNDFTNALQSFKQASEKVNNNQASESRYMIAEILFKQGKFTEAEAQCNEANDKNAAYPYWIAKSLLLLSDIYVNQNDLFNARAALEAIIENFSDDKDLIASAQEKLKAIEVMEKQKNRIKPTNNNLLELQTKGGN